MSVCVLPLLLLLRCFSRVRLCDPIDGSPPGFPVPRVLQARTLEWVAIPFSSACMLSSFSRVRLCATLWTAVTRLLCPRDSLGKSTGVGCHFLLWCVYIYIYKAPIIQNLK